MNKTIFTALVCALVFLTASCDKIEQDRYTVPAGATGQWFPSHENIPNIQRAMIEKYTGVRCVNCPDADEVIHASLDHYGDNLVAVAIHSGAFGRPLGSDPDLRTEGGTVWYETLVGTSTGLPAAMVNRGDLFNPLSGINDKVDQILAYQPPVSMLMSAASNNDLLMAEIHIGFLQSFSQPLNLTLLLTEDNILTTQTHVGGDIHDYAQNHVLRTIYTDAWGFPIDVDKTEGSKYFINLPINLPEQCVAGNCHLVAFISDQESRKILNVVQCDLVP